MHIDSWLLCQQHAATLDVRALYTFLLRERCAKEARARYWRLWWVVEHHGDDGAATEERSIVQRQADQWRERSREYEQDQKRIAREEFKKLFRTSAEGKADHAARTWAGRRRAQAERDAKRFLESRPDLKT